MTVLRDLGATLFKMFAADLVMTVIALAAVALTAALLAWRLAPVAWAPFLLTGGVLAALVIAVARGARR